jgi:hypothetical protein
LLQAPHRFRPTTAASDDNPQQRRDQQSDLPLHIFDGPINGKTVFHPIDGEYFLIQIWEPTVPTYQQISEGKHTQELANHQNSKALVAIAAH